MISKPTLSLAPLAGFTAAPFRKLCQDWGADLVYTEMVSAAGLAHGSSPTRHLMETLPGERAVVCQLFGNNPEELAFAAAEATKLRAPEDDSRPRFVGIDLNAGCPMPKIVREGAGAALIPHPARIQACLKAMVAATPLPVTLKTRPGSRPDRILMRELLDAAETAGCRGLTLHARFTSQKHGGPVHLDLLADLVQHAQIPITGNGGVTDAATYAAMADTGVAGIMIGRGALAAPWIFQALKGELPNLDAQRSALQDAAYTLHLANLDEFHAQLVRNFPLDPHESAAALRLFALRTHLFRYFTGRPGAADYRRRLHHARTENEIPLPPSFHRG